MNGLLGVVRRDWSASAIYDRGASARADTTRRRTTCYRDPGDRWAVGLSTLGILEQPPADGADASPLVVFRGDLYNEAALRAEIHQPDGSVSDLLAALYARLGQEMIARLDGAFALAIIDRASRCTHLASDAFGSYPIYWRSDAAGLTFGSELASVLRASDATPALSLTAVADYLTLGFVLGEKTLAAGVALLDPGVILTYDWSTGAVTMSRYFEAASLFEGPRLGKRAYVEAVSAAFERAVSKALTGAHRFGLSLSGGLDSRAVLSAVNGFTGLITYTLGVAGCADQAIARQLSRLTGTDHRFFELDERYLRDFLSNQARMVSITDGMYLSHGLTEMLAIEFLQATGIEVLLRGHGGELAKTRLAWPLHTDDRVYGMARHDEFVDYMTARANYISSGLSLETLFSAEAARLSGSGAADSVRALLDPVPLSPPDLCSYLYLREHHRRFTIPSLELFRTVVEVRLPFMDREFLQVLLSGDPAWRADTSLHRAITRAGNPALLKVRNSNTGAPGDAGPLVEMVLDKMNTILKRLNTPGFRHYHDFDVWLRTRLLEAVERELLAPEARSRIFLRPDALRTIIDQTRSGKTDRGYLLQILLILELWLREQNIDQVAA